MTVPQPPDTMLARGARADIRWHARVLDRCGCRGLGEAGCVGRSSVRVIHVFLLRESYNPVLELIIVKRQKMSIRIFTCVA